MTIYGVRLCISVLGQLKSAKWGKGWSVSWVASPFFFLFFLLDLSNIENERVASFFGIVALGSQKPILAQDWYVCWGSYWFSAKRPLAKLHQYCSTFVTTCLGMLLLSFCFFGGKGGGVPGFGTHHRPKGEEGGAGDESMMQYAVLYLTQQVLRCDWHPQSRSHGCMLA